jgi:isoleucyl-tRNA synthetase
VLPNEVPRLPASEKLWLEDTSASAPGADAFRWFFYAASPSWTNTRHSLTNVRLEQKEFLVKLRNVFSFFTIYANIDGFDPARGNPNATSVDASSLAKSQGYRAPKDRTELDRWMLSELAIATRAVTAALDGYQLYDAARALVELVESTSNWYVRRSRARFWAHGSFTAGTASEDKADAYFTLYEVLVTIARLAAPFVPFFAEELYQNLVVGPWSAPSSDEARIDNKLAREMRAVRDVVSLGQKVRTAHKLKTRAALAVADIIVSDRGLRDALASHTALVSEELNVETVRFLEPGQEGDVVSYTLKPNFRALGPKLGKKVQVAKTLLAKANASKLRTELAETGKVSLDLADGASPSDVVELTEEEIQVAVEAKEGFAAAGGKVGVVVLDCHQTEALKDKTLAREILARVQGLRKELNLDFIARIELGVAGSERVERVVRGARDLFVSESQATKILVGESEVGATFGADQRRLATVEGEELTIALRVVA